MATEKWVVLAHSLPVAGLKLWEAICSSFWKPLLGLEGSTSEVSMSTRVKPEVVGLVVRVRERELVRLA